MNYKTKTNRKSDLLCSPIENSWKYNLKLLGSTHVCGLNLRAPLMLHDDGAENDPTTRLMTLNWFQHYLLNG